MAMARHFRTVRYRVESGGSGRRERLVMVSDLHKARYGRNQCILMAAIRRCRPDALLLCGDIFHHKPTESSREFLRQAAAFPCFFVTGNHETRGGVADERRRYVRSLGIRVPEGTCEVLEANGRQINLCGVEDPRVVGREAMHAQLAAAREACRPGLFTVLMAHHPEWIRQYLPYGFDLVLSGHAHGGQWRVPGLIDGLFASGQGFFPTYTGGRYDFGRQIMIVGRGLTPVTHYVPRLFNPPELVVVDLV